MTTYDEERLGALLRLLPPAPTGWIEAAQELPRTRAELDELVKRAEQDASFRTALIADLEEALRIAAQNRAIFEEAAVGMAVRDLEGRWLQVNRKLCEILGYSRGELLATTSIALTPPQERARAVEYNRRIALGLIDSYSREKHYVHRAGHAVWCDLALSLVRDADGRPDYVISVIVDISARKAAQLRAEAADACANPSALGTVCPRLGGGFPGKLG